MREKLTDKRLQTMKPASGYTEVWDTMLPGFGVRVSPKGRKAFICKTRVNGRQRRYTVGTYPVWSLSKARGEARSIMEQAARGVDYKAQLEAERQAAQRRQRDTVEGLAWAFVEEYVRPKQLRSAPEIERVIDREILSRWRDRPVGEITRNDVKAALSDKARESASMASKMLEVVRRMYNWAIDEGVVDVNPAQRVVAPAPKIERERVLSEVELRLFWQSADALNWPFGPLFRLTALTAQRRGEVASMRWSELDLKAGTWTLPGETAKSGTGHLVPLPPAAVELLQELPRIGTLVFQSSGRRGSEGEGQPRPVSGWSKAKRRLDKMMTDQAAEEGIDRPGAWRVHDLRRTAATTMRTLGHDRLTVSKVLNHREAGVTQVYDRYSMDPEKRAALDGWAAYLDSFSQ